MAEWADPSRFDEQSSDAVANLPASAAVTKFVAMYLEAAVVEEKNLVKSQQFCVLLPCSCPQMLYRSHAASYHYISQARQSWDLICNGRMGRDPCRFHELNSRDTLPRLLPLRTCTHSTCNAPSTEPSHHSMHGASCCCWSGIHSTLLQSHKAAIHTHYYVVLLQATWVAFNNLHIHQQTKVRMIWFIYVWFYDLLFTFLNHLASLNS